MSDEILHRLRELQARMDAMPLARAELIAEARDAGLSWVQIGSALGMSHVAAMKAARPSPRIRKERD